MGSARLLLFGFGAGIVVGAAGMWFHASWDTEDVRRYREIRDYVREAYVGALDDAEIADRAFHGLAAGLDGHSAYFDPEEARFLDRETVGRYFGLGIVLRRPFEEGVILFPLGGGPAERAGLRVGDRIVAIEGEAFASLPEGRFRELVSTPEPRDVALDVVGLDGIERSVVVRTASVLEPSVRHARELAPGIGYVSIASFSQETPEELTEAIARLRRDRASSGLVLDLRGNPGGVLASAVDIARRFVREGAIVTTHGRGTSETVFADPARATLAGSPVVVLVDGSSASASEVLAGCLQDHRAAVLVGTPTYGKGSVQTIRRFDEDGAAIKVTTSHYATSAGRRLERLDDGTGGLEPDVVVEISPEQRRVIHAWLDRTEPPEVAVEALRSWEARDGVALLEPPPEDPQLDAAVALLGGARPGPWRDGGVR